MSFRATSCSVMIIGGELVIDGTWYLGDIHHIKAKVLPLKRHSSKEGVQEKQFCNKCCWSHDASIFNVLPLLTSEVLPVRMRSSCGQPGPFGLPNTLILCSCEQQHFSISEQEGIVILHVVILLKGVKGRGWLKEITVGSCIKAPEFRIQMESCGIISVWLPQYPQALF